MSSGERFYLHTGRGGRTLIGGRDAAIGQHHTCLELRTPAFTDTAAPVSESPVVMKAAISAPNATITTTVSAAGVRSLIQPIAGEAAQFESQVTITGHGTLEEHGNISYGAGNRLRFSTQNDGCLGPSAQEGPSAGVVLLKVSGGEGQLAGVSGYITSNFSVNATGEIRDNQVGVLFSPTVGSPEAGTSACACRLLARVA